MRTNRRRSLVLRALACLCAVVPAAALAGSAHARSFSVEERVEARRAVEEVYWRHRIWPAGDRVPKPALSQVLADDALRAKVDDGLAKSSALATLWNSAITPQQLQAEMQRMARNTQAPELLRELFEALDNDPARIAETLARPLLADRLLRGRVAAQGEESFESWWSSRRGEFAPALPDVDADYEPVTLPATDCTTDTWSHRGATPPDPRTDHTAVWTGAEMIVWGGLNDSRALDTGGRYDPATDTWTATTLAGAPASRHLHSAVWTGTEMIVWGGHARQGASFQSGGRYDPFADSWNPIATGAPIVPARGEHTAIWTGSKMIVWGGRTNGGGPVNTGGVYDPVTDAWVATSASGAPSVRYGHSAVWIGTGMLVWGGTPAAPGSFLNTGAIYEPGSDTWSPTATANAPDGRYYHTAIWSGSAMIVWGGFVSFGVTADGKRYDPATGIWTPLTTASTFLARAQHTACWTGTEMIVWGGVQGLGAENQQQTGARYSPLTDTWAVTTLIGAPDARYRHTAVWTGSAMIVWGGGNNAGFFTGGRYDPSTNRWAPTSTSGAPSGRTTHTAVWTGTEMIVWGGGSTNTGGRYDPATDDWVATSTGAGCPSPRGNHSAVWTGTEMIVWGGNTGAGSSSLDSGGRYNPATDTWLPTSTSAAPEARARHGAVWAGSEMIVWGGTDDSLDQYRGNGGRYSPGADAWLPLSATGAPAPRANHSAVWTGTEMIVWGGNDANVTFNTGARYSPAADTWVATSTGSGCPSARYRHTAVWTGSAMIVWGGDPSDTGGRYYPATNTWLGTSSAGVPSGRDDHTAVWTGREMIVWGGNTAFTTATGGRYNPAVDSDGWTATSSTGAPWPRDRHTAVWFGSRMLIWGGSTLERTVSTYCAAGGCLGLPSACDDGNACTSDSCDIATAECAHTATSCDDSNPCTSDSCDSGSGCLHAAAAGACDDGDPCTTADQCTAGLCAGNATGAPPGDVGASVRLDRMVPGMEIDWAAAPGAASYDVLRGLVAGLPVGTGSETCIDDGVVATSTVDPSMPTAGSSFWYLVRSQNACGYGTWGSQAHNGVPTATRSSAGCP